jgi:large subunit ribosomal protein L41
MSTFSTNLCRRLISTSTSLYGKKNFKKFLLYNKRGTRIFKEERIKKADPAMPIDKRGVKDTGYVFRGRYVEVPEKIPQMIVPDLTNTNFKPYVSYKTPAVQQSEFTSEDLFNAVYSQKIIDDYKNGKLNVDGSPIEPSADENLTADAAFLNARRTGSDIF